MVDMDTSQHNDIHEVPARTLPDGDPEEIYQGPADEPVDPDKGDCTCRCHKLDPYAVNHIVACCDNPNQA